MLLVQSIFTMANGMASMMFAGIVKATMWHVADGTLVIILIKPVNCLFYLIATEFNVLDLEIGSKYPFSDISVKELPLGKIIRHIYKDTRNS